MVDITEMFPNASSDFLNINATVTDTDSVNALPNGEIPKGNKRRQPEKELEQFVHSAAKTFGLFYYHTYRSRFSEPGFPDSIIIGRYIIVAELKDTGKNPTLAQQSWLETFKRIGIPVYVWRPEDKESIIKTLSDMRTT